MEKKSTLRSYFTLFILLIFFSITYCSDPIIIEENQQLDIIKITPVDDSTNITYQDFDYYSYPEWLNSQYTEYKKFLSDKYNYYITPGGNKIWVGVMNLAWQCLKHKIINGNNATFSNLTQLQSRIVANLNSQTFTKQELSQDDYYVYAGFGPQAVEHINFDVKQKFPLRTIPQLEYQLQQKDFISFAYLFKNFQYPTPFSDLSSFKFKDQLVRAFQTKTSKQKKQLYYKYYNSSEDFMIGIQTQSPNDEILLWKTNIKEINEMRIQKFLQMFNMLYRQESKHLDVLDKFIMPVIELDYSRNYKEMVDLEFTNKQIEQYKIKTMQENLKVKVTKEGVRLQAQAVIIVSKSMQILERQFYLNNDFWLIMKEKNKLPYLISYISTVNQTWSG